MPTTTSYNRGAVVLLPFPFSDQSSSKIRPAVVVSPGYPSDDLLVVAVTSVGETLRPGEFPVQFWREAGLIRPSSRSAPWHLSHRAWFAGAWAGCVDPIWRNSTTPSRFGLDCRA